MVKTLNPRIRTADVMPDAVTVAKMNEYHHTDIVADTDTVSSHGLGVEPTVVHTSIKSGEVVADVTHVATASTLILKAATSGVIVEWQILA